MKAATESRPEGDFPAPSNVVRVRVDPLTGYLASPYCPVTMEGLFPKSLAPTEVCPFHTSTARVASAPEPAADDDRDKNIDPADSPSD